jgi:peptide deformylase
MSEIFKFNTEDAVKVEQPKRQVNVPIFNLVPETDPILKEVLPEFDFENPSVNPNEFASSMVETCIKHNGYGLSANQCGFKYRMFVMGAKEDYVAFFNPSIVLKSKKEVHMVEGCLSFPMLSLGVTRPEEIAVTYQDFNGNWQEATFHGISARIFQHELDHLNGIVYTSRAKPMALQSGMKKRGKLNHLLNKMNKTIEKMEHGNSN